MAAFASAVAFFPNRPLSLLTLPPPAKSRVQLLVPPLSSCPAAIFRCVVTAEDDGEQTPSKIAPHRLDMEVGVVGGGRPGIPAQIRPSGSATLPHPRLKTFFPLIMRRNCQKKEENSAKIGEAMLIVVALAVAALAVTALAVAALAEG